MAYFAALATACHDPPRFATACHGLPRRDGLSLCHNDIAVGMTVGLAVVIGGGLVVELADCRGACRGDGHLIDLEIAVAFRGDWGVDWGLP